MSRSSFVSAIRLVAGLALLALLLAQATGHLPLRAVSALDGVLHDLRLRALPSPAADARVAVVDIDERSLAEFGRWPWPRERQALLVERLFEREGVVLAGLDTILAEPESEAADARLAEVFSRHPVVLGLHFSDKPDAPRQGALPPGLPASAAAGFTLLPWQGHATSLPRFQQAAAGAGFLNAMIDRDGITRRAPLLAAHEGSVQPSLALALAYALMGDRALATTMRADLGGQVLIPYPAEEGRVLHVAAGDVLAGRLPPGTLKGRVVLVGTTAAGLMDQHLTPTSALLPGVELHANVLSGLLAGNLPAVPREAPALLAALLLASAALLMLALPRLEPWPAAGLALALAAALVAGNFAAWHAGWALPLAALLLLVGGLYVLQLFFGHLGEVIARRRLAALFGQYVPPELVAQMSRDPERYSMEGRSAELTVLFSDVRGFTTFSEKLSPTDLATLMNRYFGVMTEIVRQQRGTLDKYVGDALMAFWGAPLDDPAHAEHAVQTALAMQAALPALNAELAAHGWPPIRITIGVNTGTVVVGDMGSVHRRAYTVLGDAVNVASRLQELSGKLEVPVLIGEATAAALPAGWQCREVERVAIRGRETRMTVYEPKAN